MGLVSKHYIRNTKKYWILFIIIQYKIVILRLRSSEILREHVTVTILGKYNKTSVPYFSGGEIKSKLDAGRKSVIFQYKHLCHPLCYLGLKRMYVCI